MRQYLRRQRNGFETKGWVFSVRWQWNRNMVKGTWVYLKTERCRPKLMANWLVKSGIDCWNMILQIGLGRGLKCKVSVSSSPSPEGQCVRYLMTEGRSCWDGMGRRIKYVSRSCVKRGEPKKDIPLRSEAGQDIKCEAHAKICGRRGQVKLLKVW